MVGAYAVLFVPDVEMFMSLEVKMKTIHGGDVR
jgi:hypothetical protein